MAAYDAAARYYQAHGDLNVPSEYIDPDGVLLGKWVSRQRYAWQNPDRSSARLTPERKALLDQLGMVWQKPDSCQHTDHSKKDGNSNRIDQLPEIKTVFLTVCT